MAKYDLRPRLRLLAMMLSTATGTAAGIFRPFVLPPVFSDQPWLLWAPWILIPAVIATNRETNVRHRFPYFVVTNFAIPSLLAGGITALIVHRSAGGGVKGGAYLELSLAIAALIGSRFLGRSALER